MIDRLIQKIEVLGAPIVVGLDPTPEVVPEAFFSDAAKVFGETPEAGASALLKFNREVIDAVADVVPAVKPNIAFFERYGVDGIRSYIMTIEYAMARGLMVIGDVKRGDIGSTAAAYAGHIEPAVLYGRKFEIWNEDAVTLNPYLGSDSIMPFLDVLKVADKGVFVLVKTSNPGSADIQDLMVASPGCFAGEGWKGAFVGCPAGEGGDMPIVGCPAGEGGDMLSAGCLEGESGKGSFAGCPAGEGRDMLSAGCPAREGGDMLSAVPLYEHVAARVSAWGVGEGLIGRYGYSKVGAVVGATRPEVGERLRGLMPHTFFLVPGYGAQGASAEDVGKFFDANRRGAIVNSSRGIIGAWKADGNGAGRVGESARAAAIRMRDELGAVL